MPLGHQFPEPLLRGVVLLANGCGDFLQVTFVEDAINRLEVLHESVAHQLARIDAVLEAARKATVFAGLLEDVVHSTLLDNLEEHHEHTEIETAQIAQDNRGRQT